MSSTDPFTELEYLILAMISQGNTSGYAMKKQMMRMPGGRWSAESGSVYRVVRRLQVRGLVAEARRVGVPNRERTEYDLTQQGEAVLRDWLTVPPDRVDMAFMIDPIRTRSYFLSVLTPAERTRSVRTWIEENKSFIADLQREVAANAVNKTLVELIPHNNLLHLALARHEWLKRSLIDLKKVS